MDKILELKAKDINNDTKEFEREINELVYRLYDLTEEERKIIENAN